MSESTKQHFYLQTARSIALANKVWCGGKVMIYVIPPEKAISIENIYIHFKATFDAGIASGNRIIRRISIVDKKPIAYNSNSDLTYYRYMDLNITADVNRKVEIKLDLTNLLKKDNAKYREIFDDDSSGGFTYVMIEPVDALLGVTNIGIIDLWKVDAQFTTQGTQ